MTEPDRSPSPSTPPSPIAVAYEVPNLGLIRLRGRDSLKVLSGLCTAKLQDSAVGQSQEAFFTDDRGRVIAHAIVGQDAEGAWVIGQIAQPEALAQHIDRFIFREDASPSDATGKWNARLVDGSEALSRLSEIVAADSVTLASLGIGSFRVSDIDVIIVRLPITSPAALLCLVPAEHAAVLERALASAGFETQPASGEFESRRIANFWPVAGREISDRTLPQELDRDERAISFTKGCYLGQETVARLDAMGQVQRKLCLVRIEGAAPAEAGAKLMRDDKEVGQLTSVAPLSIDGCHLGLAYMRRGSFAAGSEFQLNGHLGTVIAHPL